MPLYGKLLVGCGLLLALGFLMVGAMVLFGLMISRPEQRRIRSDAPPSLASAVDAPAYPRPRCDPPSTTS